MSGISSGFNNLFSQRDHRFNRDEFNQFLRKSHLANPNSKQADLLWQQADRNKNGYISNKEMRNFLKKMMNQASNYTENSMMRNLLEMADRNGDGRVSNQEMKRLFDKLERMANGDDNCQNNASDCAGDMSNFLDQLAQMMQDASDSWNDECGDKDDNCGSSAKSGCNPCAGYDAPASYNTNDVASTLLGNDSNGDAALNRDEYGAAMRELGIQSKSAQDSIWGQSDADKSGRISFAEMDSVLKSVTGADGKLSEDDFNRLMNRSSNA